MSTKLPPFLCKVLKIIVMAILVFVVLTIVAVIYGEQKIKWAKKQVEAFNQFVVIGRSVAGLENKAKEMHLNYERIGRSNEMDGAFAVWEGFVFRLWFCDVEYKDGKATNKKVSFHD